MITEKIKNFYSNNKTILLFTFLVALILFFISFVISKTKSENFFQSMELKSFDLRQSIIAEHKKPTSDVVILTVDDESYEYLINKYGEWPIPRHIYAKILDYVESQNPSVVGFDLLFVHSMRNNKDSDNKLAAAFKKYDNAFTAINFDDRDFTVRKPVTLPEKMTVNLNVKSSKFSPAIYKNCRSILPQIIENTENIGHINTAKDDDGITRSVPLFVAYPRYSVDAQGNYTADKNDIYPYMTLKMALKYIANKNNITVDDIVKNSTINNKYFEIMPNLKLPMSSDGRVTLNWFGDTGLVDSNNFKYIPLWKVVESMDGGKEVLEKDTFTNKVVFVGTSVFSLSDIKSVPTSKYMPGVEVHATLFDNIVNQSLIKSLSPVQNIVIAAVIAAIVAFIGFYCASVGVALTLSSLVLIGYSILSTIVMQCFNLWIWLTLPITLSFIAIVAVYIIKYVLKSRDFELTYKLATTDGLTDLYNHRFFQEQMKICIDDCKRYNRNFSLIMIDIDFFKKFNDTYGHQAGDAVLRGVAHTLKRNVRSSDIVCRYGGEEMAIILKDTAFEEANLIADKICKTIAAKPFKIAANTEKQVTISLGVSTYPICGLETQEMIEFADRGLYAAKENGRNQVGKVQLPE